MKKTIKLELLPEAKASPNLLKEAMWNASVKDGQFSKCRKCLKKYIIKGWNFYNLCDSCFVAFDSQKMQGRFGKYLGGQENLKWFEDVDEWLKSLIKKI